MRKLTMMAASALLLTCSFSSHAFFWMSDYTCKGTHKNTGEPLPNVQVRAFTEYGAGLQAILMWSGQANPFAVYCEKKPL
ncbi:hypothetical protein [Cedecea sp.]|uniref:hypothetical protein n=1 Tax=Cedecea sp. TaxID=1970739 RepID=UPI0012AE5055|nr:hypothetical protein [Enterobacteriaceae bacterium RIT693]